MINHRDVQSLGLSGNNVTGKSIDVSAQVFQAAGPSLFLGPRRPDEVVLVKLPDENSLLTRNGVTE